MKVEGSEDVTNVTCEICVHNEIRNYEIMKLLVGVVIIFELP